MAGVTVDSVAMLKEAVTAYRAMVDDAAGAARLRYVTKAHMQQAVYDIKASEAAALAAAGYVVAGVDCPLLTAEAAASGKTLADVARGVLSTRKAWLGIAGKIEAVRLGGKAAVMAAADENAAYAAMLAAVDQLQKI